MKWAPYVLFAIVMMSVVVDAWTLSVVGATRTDAGAGGGRGNLLHRIKRNVIFSRVCPEETVWKGWPFFCITCEKFTEYTGNPC